MSEFIVKREKFGIAVFGAIPMSDFTALTSAWDKDGYKWMRPDIADVLDACLVLVRNEADAKLWLEAIGAGPNNPDWLKSGDTGISSRTIYAFFTDNRAVLKGSMPSTPRDADDFGRCYRLLKRYPEWRPRIGEVAALCSEFSGLASVWDQLDRAFEAGDFAGVTKLIHATLYPKSQSTAGRA